MINFLFFFLSLFSIFQSEYIFSASTSEYDIRKLNYLDYFWSGTENELFFNIHLANGLEFDTDYQRVRLENGHACSVTFNTLPGYLFASSEGHILEKIILLLEIKNGDDPIEINFKITIRSFYNKINHEGKVITMTQQSNLEGRLANPSIDLNYRPEVFTHENDTTKGFISFKNSFPYSSI